MHYIIQTVCVELSLSAFDVHIALTLAEQEVKQALDKLIGRLIVAKVLVGEKEHGEILA